MRTPMVLLAVICAVVGLFPPAVAPFLEAALFAWQPALAVGEIRLATSAPLWLTLLSVVLLCLLLVAAIYLARRVRATPHATGFTWDCGYLRPAPRMQYSSSSFAEILVKFLAACCVPIPIFPLLKACFPAPHTSPATFQKLCLS